MYSVYVLQNVEPLVKFLKAKVQNVEPLEPKLVKFFPAKNRLVKFVKTLRYQKK